MRAQRPVHRRNVSLKAEQTELGPLSGDRIPEEWPGIAGLCRCRQQPEIAGQGLPAPGEAREISAVLPTASGHLLIGTSKRGVLMYDGKRLTVFHPELDRMHVTALAGSDVDLWVGTIDRGIVHFHGGRAEVIGEQQGMPDREVLSIAISGDTTFVGTATGVAGVTTRTASPPVPAGSSSGRRSAYGATWRANTSVSCVV